MRGQYCVQQIALVNPWAQKLVGNFLQRFLWILDPQEVPCGHLLPVFLEQHTVPFSLEALPHDVNVLKMLSPVHPDMGKLAQTVREQMNW